MPFKAIRKHATCAKNEKRIDLWIRSARNCPYAATAGWLVGSGLSRCISNPDSCTQRYFSWSPEREQYDPSECVYDNKN